MMLTGENFSAHQRDTRSGVNSGQEGTCDMRRNMKRSEEFLNRGKKAESIARDTARIERRWFRRISYLFMRGTVDNHEYSGTRLPCLFARRFPRGNYFLAATTCRPGGRVFKKNREDSSVLEI